MPRSPGVKTSLPSQGQWWLDGEKFPARPHRGPAYMVGTDLAVPAHCTPWFLNRSLRSVPFCLISPGHEPKVSLSDFGLPS
jgi:hypothetical protein